MLKKILLSLLVVLVLIQLVPIDRSVPDNIQESASFFSQMEVPSDVQSLMEQACLDCHSYKTNYPWYSYIAPVKFFLSDHIQEGREHLNFDEWASYSKKKADHKLEECVEELEEGEMPLEGYALVHSEADLSEEEREMLMDFFRSLRS